MKTGKPVVAATVSLLFNDEYDEEQYWELVVTVGNMQYERGAYLTAGAALDAAVKWAEDRNLELRLDGLSLPVFRKGGGAKRKVR